MKSKLDIRKFFAVVIVACFFVAFKQDKKELSNELRFMRSNMDNLPLPVCDKDLNGNLTYFNEAFNQLVFVPMGLDKDTMLGKSGAVIFGEEKNKEYLKHDSIIINKRKVQTFTESGKDLQEVVHTLKVSKYPIIVNDEVIGIGVVAYYEF